MRILVVCGLNREAAIAAGPDIVVVAGGGSRGALQTRLAALGDAPVRAVISFGLAGALVPGLKPGAIILPGRVLAPDGTEFEADSSILARWHRVLDTPGGHPVSTTSMPDLAGSDIPLLERSAKRALAFGGGSAVDMESHVAATYAKSRGLPFAALRVISDGANRDLPPAAGAAMRPDGSIDIGAVLGSILRKPDQIPALLRTARDAGRAFATLGRVRGLLGPRLGLDL